jgi:hypothetical protein
LSRERKCQLEGKKEIFDVCFVPVMGYHAVDWLCCTYEMNCKRYLYMYGNYVTLVPKLCINLFNVVYLSYCFGTGVN